MSQYPQQKWAEDRAAYYKLLDEDQKKVLEDIDFFKKSMVDKFEAKQDKVTAEVNEYERHATGFFALCLSLLVTGLLTSQLDTLACHLGFKLSTLTTEFLYPIEYTGCPFQVQKILRCKV